MPEELDKQSMKALKRHYRSTVKKIKKLKKENKRFELLRKKIIAKMKAK